MRGERDFVVAIDLGTSRTAYSWKSSRHADVTVKVPDKAVDPEDVREKTPTVLLVGAKRLDRGTKSFEHDGVEAFGLEAQERFREKDNVGDSQLFQQFKMELYKENQTGDNLYNAAITSFTGVAELKLRDVFFLALEHVKDAALQSLEAAGVKPDRISWVLTVPACCSDPAKDFMRDAAVRAGLIKGGDEKYLRLCKEPVAACLALKSGLRWKVGDKYLVVDCGGGTVDMSAFEVTAVNPPALTQVGDNISEKWGSTYVDAKFILFLEEFLRSLGLGDRQCDAFDKDGMYIVLQDWEEAKVGLKNVRTSIRINLSVLEGALGVNREAMDAGRDLKNKEQDLVGGSGMELVLKPALLRSFFSTQCHRIAEAVSGKLVKEELQGLTSVVMVGGFSGSVHVQEAVQKVLEGNPNNRGIPMVVAPNPDLAVVHGAALYPDEPGPKRRYPTPTPKFKQITCDASYGMLVAQTGTSHVPEFFDACLIKGRGYPDGHTDKFDYFIEASGTLELGSCANPLVQPGRNKLSDLGGPTAVHITNTKSIPVPENWGMCCGRATSVVAQDEKSAEDAKSTPISVQFSIIGIELHVTVKSKGFRPQVLLSEVMNFS